MSKVFWKHKHALTSELPFSPVKRFAERTSFLLGGCVYLSALSDAMVLRRPGEIEMCCAHSFQKVSRYHLNMNTQNSFFLPLKLSHSGWFSPVSSVCWHQCAAVVKGTELLLCCLQGRWECCTVISSTYLLTYSHRSLDLVALLEDDPQN